VRLAIHLCVKGIGINIMGNTDIQMVLLNGDSIRTINFCERRRSGQFPAGRGWLRLTAAAEIR
jgi:hypothetical protein